MILALAVSVLTLPIGRPGTIAAHMGYTSTATGQPTSPAEIVRTAAGCRAILIGETHDSPACHKAEADLIEAAAASGQQVVVGMEMFTRDNQRNVAPWSRGFWSDEEFQQESNWKKQWGFPYALYKPVFDVIKARRIPLVALNVPRDWVRQVGKDGVKALTPDKREWVPSLDTANASHRQIFGALMDGHPMTGTMGENIYAAQVMWDTGMAKTACDELAARPGALIVILAGSGHVMYGQGIAFRMAQLGVKQTFCVVAAEGEEGTQVSRGFGDCVFLYPKGQ